MCQFLTCIYLHMTLITDNININHNLHFSLIKVLLYFLLAYCFEINIQLLNSYTSTHFFKFYNPILFHFIRTDHNCFYLNQVAYSFNIQGLNFRYIALHTVFYYSNAESFGQQGIQTSQSQRKSTLSIHWKDWCWSWSSNSLATRCEELTHWKRRWFWESLRAREGGNRQWKGWMVSLTQWTWVWANSEVLKDREAWHAAILGATKSQTQLSDWTITTKCYTYFSNWHSNVWYIFLILLKFPFFLTFSFSSISFQWCFLKRNSGAQITMKV